MTKLSGVHFKDIYKSLIDGFNHSTLSRMVKIHFDENLYAIVRTSNLNDEIDDLIRWAECHDKVQLLIQAAQAENRSNQKIQNLSQILKALKVKETLGQSTLSFPLVHTPNTLYHSIFISYSNHDEEFAEKLHADLGRHGVNCWFAPHDLPTGAQIRPNLHKKIEQQSKLLLILSKHSVNSEWVGDEVETALDFERQSKKLKLFPLRIDNCVLQVQYDWAASIRRTRNIGDFQQWRNSAHYKILLQRILRDLKK
ncbi:MAG: toll/interleukin-1 receptor domain-containing protein [Candidatus Promineifilaceae bacterium]